MFFCVGCLLWQLNEVQARIIDDIPIEGLTESLIHPRRLLNVALNRDLPTHDDALVLNPRGKFDHSGVRNQRNVALDKLKTYRIRRKSRGVIGRPQAFQSFPASDHMEAPQDNEFRQEARQGRAKFSSHENAPIGLQTLVPPRNFQPPNGIVSSTLSSRNNQFSGTEGNFHSERFRHQPNQNQRTTQSHQLSQNQRNPQNNFNQHSGGVRATQHINDFSPVRTSTQNANANNGLVSTFEPNRDSLRSSNSLGSFNQPQITNVNTNVQSFNPISNVKTGRSNQRQVLRPTSNSFASSQNLFNSDLGRQGRQNIQSSQEIRQGRDGHDNGYIAPAEEPPTSYGTPSIPQEAPSPPIEILKMTGLDTGPIPSFNYMYSTANDINVMAEGELKNICDEDVSIMKGSYDYVGADGKTYKVEWYADETGFHPTLDHLPQPVKPNHPEVAAAVAAQLAAAGQAAPAPPMPCPPKITPLPSYDSPLPGYDSKI